MGRRSEKFFTSTILSWDSDDGYAYVLVLVDDVSSFVSL